VANKSEDCGSTGLVGCVEAGVENCLLMEMEGETRPGGDWRETQDSGSKEGELRRSELSLLEVSETDDCRYRVSK
jgi:hypothetical protein